MKSRSRSSDLLFLCPFSLLVDVRRRERLAASNKSSKLQHTFIGVSKSNGKQLLRYTTLFSVLSCENEKFVFARNRVCGILANFEHAVVIRVCFVRDSGLSRGPVTFVKFRSHTKKLLSMCTSLRLDVRWGERSQPATNPASNSSGDAAAAVASYP